VPVVNEADLNAYQARIAVSGPAEPSEESLRVLHRSHLFSVPFENLSIHLGEPVILEESALIDKLVKRRRGGFCYELNGGMAVLLTSLGFQVTLLGARAFGPHGSP
jgi:N-hydroxyarylamine O-acetyltransferase